MRVASLDRNLLRFLAVSLALHLAAFLYWLDFPRHGPGDAPIRVALLPPQETPAEPAQDRARPSPPPKSAKAARPPRQAPARISRVPAIIAKKDSPIFDEKPSAPAAKPAPKEPQREAPASAGQFEENPLLAERLLPSLKQLLPSLGQTGKDADGPIPLNTSDPKYRTYLKDVQQIIDANWKYPELALQYGLQGTVLIEFVIMENGRVEGLKLIRSSGFRLLDQEVLRAIMASSPFGRLPPWFESKELWVSATMEYHDGRFKAWLAR